VLEGLRWLGLHWDEGPEVGGPYGPYRQSERADAYRAYAKRLVDAGRAYPCFCTPDELDAERARAHAEGRAYRYPGTCRTLAPEEAGRRMRAGEPYALRFAVEPRPMAYVDLVQGPIELDGALISDPVIVRTNGHPTYNFATVVNEVEMAISHVLRSAEHISNTFLQLQIYAALGVEPPAFGHFSLLLNPDKSKISKRSGATFVGEFRDMGYLPEAMLNHLALSGWNPGTDEEWFSLDELVERFSLARCSPANAVYDRDKLLWMNGATIRRLSVDELARRLLPWLVEGGVLRSEALGPDAFARLAGIVTLEQERLKTLADAPDALRFFYHDPAPADALALLGRNRYARRHTPPELAAALAAALTDLRALDAGHWTLEHLQCALDALGARLGWKRAELLMPLRIAVSGRAATPPLFETLAHLGRAATLRRLEAVLVEMRVLT
jgi:glutamyl-tRNA synthetase